MTKKKYKFWELVDGEKKEKKKQELANDPHKEAKEFYQNRKEQAAVNSVKKLKHGGDLSSKYGDVMILNAQDKLKKLVVPVPMPEYKNSDDKSVKMPKYKNKKDKSVKMPKVEREEYIMVPKDTSKLPQLSKGGGIAIKGTKFTGVF
tara:strand:+ start:7 stop:447 length:441 start_codon:yes stop_codon:yes gene_type:complete